MPSVFTIQGADLGRSKPQKGDCKCVKNPKTGSTTALCFVGKSKKHKSGWKFAKGGASRCRR